MRKIKLKMLNITLVDLEYSSGVKAKVGLYLLVLLWILTSNLDKIEGMIR